MRSNIDSNKMSYAEIIRNMAIVAGVGLIVLPLLELSFGTGKWLTVHNILEWIVTAMLAAGAAGIAWFVRKNI